MEEKILEIIKRYDEMAFSRPSECAKEITAHVMEFIEWAKSNCMTGFKDMKDGMMWGLYDDLHPWDNVPRKWYSSEELYQYWLNNVKK
jgi:hypothetical protein